MIASWENRGPATIDDKRKKKLCSVKKYERTPDYIFIISNLCIDAMS